MLDRRRLGLLVCALGIAACGGGTASSGHGGAGGAAGAPAGGSSGGANPTGGGAGGAPIAGSGGGMAGAAGTALGRGGSSSAGTGGGGVAGAGGAGGGAGGSGGGGRAGTGGGAGGSAGGAGGSAGSAGGSGGAGVAPIPSAGCALAIAKPATTSETTKFQVTRKFPTRYDGVTPFPLILALHATNYSPSGLAQTLVLNQPAADDYVVAAPFAAQFGTFESIATADVASMLGELLAELCVDQRRVFGVGSGSGGRSVVVLADYVAKTGIPLNVRFRGLGMVGTFYGSRTGPYPTIFIHPLYSPNSASVAQDADGAKAVQTFRTRNMCGEESTPVSVPGCVSGGKTVNPGCVDFDACTAPLRFCHHDDPIGMTTGDPWPCFATAAIYQFFEPHLGGAPSP